MGLGVEFTKYLKQKVGEQKGDWLTTAQCSMGSIVELVVRTNQP